jgi:hypothetical protein
MPVKSRSSYVGRRCDETDRNGNQCELPFGHDGGTRGDHVQHHSHDDDQPRTWVVHVQRLQKR